jgi:hypothetical protein
MIKNCRTCIYKDKYSYTWTNYRNERALYSMRTKRISINRKGTKYICKNKNCNMYNKESMNTKNNIMVEDCKYYK